MPAGSTTSATVPSGCSSGPSRGYRTRRTGWRTPSANASSSGAATSRSSMRPGSPVSTCRPTCRRPAPRCVRPWPTSPSLIPAIAGPSGRRLARSRLRNQAEIVDGWYEFLVVLADAVAEPLPGEDPVRQAERGLSLLDQAAGLRPQPTPTYHRQRAAYLTRMGDTTGAARERAEAAKPRGIGRLHTDHGTGGEFRTGRTGSQHPEQFLSILHRDG